MCCCEVTIAFHWLIYFWNCQKGIVLASKINWPLLLDFYYGTGSATQTSGFYRIGFGIHFSNLSLWTILYISLMFSWQIYILCPSLAFLTVFSCLLRSEMCYSIMYYVGTFIVTYEVLGKIYFHAKNHLFMCIQIV